MNKVIQAKKVKPQMPKKLIKLQPARRMKCGGWSDTMPAGEKSQTLANEMLSQVNAKLGASHSKLTAKLVSRQTVRGFKSIITCETNDAKTIKIGVFVPINVDREKFGRKTEVYYAEYL